eukprot:14271638-Ditylum_brightwellii.AAC.1
MRFNDGNPKIIGILSKERIASAGINPNGLNSKWKVPFRIEKDLNGLKENMLGEIFYLTSDSTCGLAICVDKAVMSALVTQ